MCGSSATASASACCPQRIVLNVRVTGVTVRVFVPTVPELATSTVNVVFVAPTEIAVIFAEAPTFVPAILSPTSARPPKAAFAATMVNSPETPLTAEAVGRSLWSAPSLALARREDST
jgi:hypothetical protein